MNQTCVLVYGVAYDRSVEEMLGTREWEQVWMEANGMGAVAAEEVDDAVMRLGVQVGEWGGGGGGQHGMYIALHTISFTFGEGAQAFDWRECRTYEKSARRKLTRLRAFCKAFGLAWIEPAWLQLGFEW